MLRFEFRGELIEWRGPAPFHFIAVPADTCAEIKDAAKLLSYGWGVVPAIVTIGGTEFTTSLFPRQGGYLVPIKDAVRQPEQLKLGQSVNVSLALDR